MHGERIFSDRKLEALALASLRERIERGDLSVIHLLYFFYSKIELFFLKLS